MWLGNDTHPEPAMHDVMTIGIPMIAILFGIFWNQRAVDKLEVHMDKKFVEFDRRFSGRFDGVDSRLNRLESRMDRMQADLSGFYREMGRMDAEITHLKDQK